MTNDEKWFNKKMDRREFLKKQGLRRWSCTGCLWCICFFSLIRRKKIRNSLTVRKKSASTGSIRRVSQPDAEEYLLCRVGVCIRQIGESIIQLFKDWTAYSEKLVDGELVKKIIPMLFCRQRILEKLLVSTLIDWPWPLVSASFLKNGLVGQTT